MILHDELLSFDNQSLMLLLFCRTYPGIGGQSGSLLNRVSSLDLKAATEFANLIFFGSTLNKDGPTSENELHRIVFILAFLDINRFRLHFGPCLEES